MPTPAQVLKAVRVTHLYFGVFIAPALIFFAFTGALQTFNLHEAGRGSSTYKPPAWIVALGELHKKQTTESGRRGPGRRGPGPGGNQPGGNQPGGNQPGDRGSGGQAGGGQPDRGQAGGDMLSRNQPGGDRPQGNGPDGPDGPGGPRGPEGPQQQKSHIPMKIFFLVVSIGLMIASLTGIYMAYKYNRSKLWVTVTLVAGVVIPLLLLPF